MLSQQEFLSLHRLNRRAYKVDVGRVQTKFLFEKPDFCLFAVCAFKTERWKHSLLTCDVNAQKFDSRENKKEIDFYNVHPIFVDGSLYCFELKQLVTVVRFDNVDKRSKLEQTDLRTYPDPRLSMTFSLTSYLNRYILVTDGNEAKAQFY